jgi:hypothetical protein
MNTGINNHYEQCREVRMKKLVLISAGFLALGLLSACVSTNRLPAETEILEDFEETHILLL